METIITYIGLSALTYLLAEGAEPIQWFKEKIKLSNFTLVNCSLCLGFWIGTLYFWNPIYGAVVSILAETISRIEKRL